MLAEVVGFFGPDSVERSRDIDAFVFFGHHADGRQILNLHLHAHLLLGVADQKPKSVEVVHLDLGVNLFENFADSMVFDPVIFRVENRLLRPIKHSNIALTVRHSAHHCLEFKRLWKGEI